MQVNDLVTNLRDLARYAHADLSVADEAADEIERLRRLHDIYHDALYRIAGGKNYADDPWDIARFALSTPTDP